MKYCFSSYNINDNALSLIDIDFQNKKYHILDKLSLYEPSFCISYENYVFTYTKNPLYLICYQIINNKLVFVCKINVPLQTLTHLYYDHHNNNLYGASYKDGSIIKVHFDIDNGLFNNLIIKEEKGLCHCVFSDGNHGIYVINIKHDLLNHYDCDLNLLDSLSFPLNTGPRHGILYDDYIYVISEYSNEVFKIKDGKIIKSAKTVYQDVKSFGATLFVDNELLYASNRGEDTIAIFDLDLHYQKSFNVYGNHSRHMICDNDYILSCNKNSNSIAIIEKNSGYLLMTIPYEKVSCVCKIK